ncbi:PaaI family thioesterase [Nocardioides anomalus]|uniref:PaaI family thioesterase n=2 Tax=Nocardioides anomalus TaxID=2712223 RepID=A0A6G6WMC9_9ACTN|nr:PaaI family thioesterase [Nocardioides anomalus]
MDDASLEGLEAERALYGPFTQAVRDLVDTAIRTQAGPEEVRRAQAEVEAITARLREEGLTGPYGVRFRQDGFSRAWGNAVVGLRNAVAPPLVVETGERGVHATFHLGAAYEGPPGSVHGGVSALVLDQMLGQAAGAGGKPGMTATLTVTYKQRTPLGDLSASAWIDRSEGHKTWARGELVGPDGVCVEAEGLFILPRWARERLAQSDEPAPRFFE